MKLQILVLLALLSVVLTFRAVKKPDASLAHYDTTDDDDATALAEVED